MPITVLALAMIAASSSPTFESRPCRDERIEEIARCGTVTVPEDRALPDRRTIALNIVVLPATSQDAPEAPIFDIDGGPGLPATKNAEFYATFGSAYRAKRDIVLVDQRGTGASNPLNCPELSDPEQAYEPLFPAGAVRECRERLEASADLTKYGTSEAVADLDAVRAALGYDTMNLFGLSYGTTVALRYMAEYPARVRAAVLMGVVPASATPPKFHAPAGQRALELLVSQCQADQDCNAQFDPEADIERIRTSLDDIEGAPPREIFFEKLRSLMYTPPGARMVPLILDRAAQGDLGPFFEATRPRSPNLYSDGMFLSVICAEAMAPMDLAAAVAAARPTEFGDYRLRRQAEACSGWPAAPLPAGYFDAVRSSAPVLLISGEWDPVTPPALADLAAETLTHAKHIILSGSGHIFDGMSGVETCLDPLILRFFESADVDAIDTSCIATMEPPGFVTSLEAAKRSGG